MKTRNFASSFLSFERKEQKIQNGSQVFVPQMKVSGFDRILLKRFVRLNKGHTRAGVENSATCERTPTLGTFEHSHLHTLTHTHKHTDIHTAVLQEAEFSRTLKLSETETTTSDLCVCVLKD